jgi:hypothetical protein
MKLVFLIFAVMVTACAYDDPHQYFLRYQARKIGGSIDVENARRKPFIEDILSSGNGIAKYWYVWPRKQGEFRFNDGTCIEIYEYDRVSRKILKTTFEGNRCVWNP